MAKIIKTYIIEGEKSRECTKCNTIKPFSQFYKKALGAFGIKSQCKECVKPGLRNDKYKNRYGIDIKTYDKMFKDCKGKCLICDTKPEKHLCVDHCHKTGKIRGLLCRKCNLLISHSLDNSRILTLAAEYLNENL